MLRESTRGRPRRPWEERARLRDGGAVASAPRAERMQAEVARGGDLAMCDGRAHVMWVAWGTVAPVFGPTCHVGGAATACQ